MDPRLIGPYDFQGEIRLKLAQGHHRLPLRIEIAALADVGKMRPGNEMDRPHHRPDQPFDMAAKARRSRRAVHEIDAVFGAGALESQSVEFGAVVDMNDAGYSPRGPFGLNPPSREPTRFVHHRMGQTKRDRRQRGRIEREMESHRHPRVDVDRQRQRRPPNRKPRDGIHDGHVHLGVVHLHDRQRRGRLQRSRRRQKNQL